MVMENQIAKGAEEHIFERHTPGQSLTNSKEQAYPWEKPPEINSVKEATQRIFLGLLEDKNLETVTDLMAEGTPVDDVAQMLLMTGFQKGKFNPDMMLSLLEPTMYMLMAIAEKSGIQEYVTYEGEEDEPDDEEEQLSGIQEAIEIAKDKIVPKAKAGVFPKEIEERLEKFTPPEQPSLLEKPETNQTESLLGREE